MVQHVLTLSVGVICLSQYLQTLIWTVKYMLKNHKHLIPFVIVTRYLNQPHPTLQILRHTCLATGTVSEGGLRVTDKNCWLFIGSYALFFFDHSSLTWQFTSYLIPVTINTLPLITPAAKRDPGRIASPGNVTYYNCRAVSGHSRYEFLNPLTHRDFWLFRLLITTL